MTNTIFYRGLKLSRQSLIKTAPKKAEVSYRGAKGTASV